MNKRVLNSLTGLERNLVAETEKPAMADLDEDTLLELHTRIRRARAKQSAAELKAERLAAAQPSGSGPGRDGTATGPNQRTSRRAQATRTTGGKKRDASTRCKGARRQAKRDSK